MIRAFTEGKDIYAIFAQSAFNNKYEDNLEFYPEGTKLIIDGQEVICGYKTHKNVEGKKRRGVGKVINLAVTYGMGPDSLASMTNRTYQEGVDLLNSFFKDFKTLKNWLDNNIETAKKIGYVEGLYGRRRHLSDVNLPLYDVRYSKNVNTQLKNFNPFLICENKEDDTLLKWKKLCSSNLTKKQYYEYKEQAKKDNIEIISNSAFITRAERQTSNSIIQGSAATLTKIAMINIFNDKELNDLGFRLLITVHDEVLGECPKENIKEVEERLNKVMIDSLKPYLVVPISCDLYSVPCWYYDEMANSLTKRLVELEQSGLTHEQAYDIIKKEHCELLEEQIEDMLKLE